MQNPEPKHSIRVHHNYLSCSVRTTPSTFSRVLPLTIQNYYYIPFCVTVHQAHKDVVADVSSSMLTDLQGLTASSASPPFILH